MQTLTVLPWLDWLALLSFFTAWIGYAWFSSHGRAGRRSLLATTNRYRHAWMLQTTARDPRMLDGLISQSLASMPSFFSSTTIIIIGGLFAVLGATQEAANVVREIPFAARTSTLVFDLKVLVLIGIFVYAFFRFTWSMRQNTFVSLAIASMPPPAEFEEDSAKREIYAARAGRLAGLAAETFNDGLRAYYFAFAVMAWFFSPWALMASTAFVVVILYSREFRSEVLELLNA
ncbi:MAG: DUF599 domain-containing protein [Burkholderiaceae bacterium]|jgi:uncharacterized membrane protein|nr:DUF599 domain-containing protein [Burkholderiaceae bacterium]